MKKKLRFLMVIGLILSISLLIAAPPVYAGRGRKDYRRDGRHYRYPYRPYPKERIRIRFTDKDIDRLIVIGGIYFLSKAISEARKPEVVYVSPPPPIYVPSPQPTYTPVVPISTVTVRNATNWYISVNINGVELNLYPGYEQTVSWTYTVAGHYIEAKAYLDRYHQQLVGTYQGNLVGYQIPWRLNLDYCSFR